MTEQPQQPAQPEVAPNKNLDILTILGPLTGTCASIGDKTEKAACQSMLLPLESGKADPIEALADIMIERPKEFDDIVDRFNVLIEKAGVRAEEKTKAVNAPG